MRNNAYMTHSHIRYPFFSQRLWNAHLSTKEMDDICGLLSRQREACDEVWFATYFGFPPLEVHKASA